MHVALGASRHAHEAVFVPRLVDPYRLFCVLWAFTPGKRDSLDAMLVQMAPTAQALECQSTELVQPASCARLKRQGLLISSSHAQQATTASLMLPQSFVLTVHGVLKAPQLPS